jgi:hypothetical protein
LRDWEFATTDRVLPFRNKRFHRGLRSTAPSSYFFAQARKLISFNTQLSFGINMKKCIFIVFGLFFLAVAQGCGSNCIVTGKVTFPDGTPLDRGTVMFENDKLAARGPIKKDGTYSLISGEMKGIPAGTYQVSIGGLTQPIVTPSANPGGAPKITSPVSPIDKKFHAATTSGLTCEVKGRTKFDITVEPPK